MPTHLKHHVRVKVGRRRPRAAPPHLHFLLLHLLAFYCTLLMSFHTQRINRYSCPCITTTGRPLLCRGWAWGLSVAAATFSLPLVSLSSSAVLLPARKHMNVKGFLCIHTLILAMHMLTIHFSPIYTHTQNNKQAEQESQPLHSFPAHSHWSLHPSSSTTTTCLIITIVLLRQQQHHQQQALEK